MHKNHTITAVFTASQKLNGVDRWLNTRDHIAYLSGYPDGTFGPDRNMTQAEVAQMFYALLNDQNVPATVSFSDVPDGAWYADAVETLASLGMFTGILTAPSTPTAPSPGLEFGRRPSPSPIWLPVPGAASPMCPRRTGSTLCGSAAEYALDRRLPRRHLPPQRLHHPGRGGRDRQPHAGPDPGPGCGPQPGPAGQFSDLNSSHWAFYPIMEASNSHDHIKAGGPSSGPASTTDPGFPLSRRKRARGHDKSCSRAFVPMPCSPVVIYT